MNLSTPPFVAQLKGRKILVVDDDRVNRRILCAILGSEGYIVAEADSGEATLETYPRFQPDLVLLDVLLPGLNGFETCRRLKATYGSSCAPIIFITAKSESSDVIEGLSAGGVDYLPKPFGEKETLARIRVHLQNRLLVEQLSSANSAKNRVLGMAAHDLRNPLASIRGFAEFLREGTVGPLTADQADLVNCIHEASQSMLQLVNELLDISVIESGELKINLEPVSLHELIEKSIYLSNINAAKKTMRIVFQGATLPPRINVDAQKLKQVLDNLLSNAIKFSPPGATITVQTETKSDRCIVRVRDQGPGVPEGERHHLFKDFGRTSVKPTAGEKSTGLGLAICRKIVEAHGGSIGAENLPGGGCEFAVSLPALPMKFSGKVLIVEDEPHIRKFVGLILKQLGVRTILEAENGEKAIAVFELEKPEVVLLDINMPFMNGLEALGKIKKANPDCIAIMITSLADQDTVEEALALGAAGYIRKDTPKAEIAKDLAEIIDGCLEPD